MRRPLLAFMFLFAAMVGMTPVNANTTYMVLEQDQAGNVSHEALDFSIAADSADPVLLHILLNQPTNPNIAQVLWVARDNPSTWVRNADDNDFEFVEFATLPEDSWIQYRIYLHGFDVELGVFRHARSSQAADWLMNTEKLNQISPGEYVLHARVVVPGRPIQTLKQRIDIIANPNDLDDENNQPPNDQPPNDQPDDGGNPDGDGQPGGGDDGNPPAIAAGFTPLVKSADTRVTYVSSSTGDDRNDGLTPETAIKTLDEAMDRLRTGKPDWVLLKCGDTWTNESFDGIPAGGAAPDKPMVISTYGNGERPLIIPPHDENGFKTINDKIKGLVIQGLHIYAETRDPGSPRFVGRGNEVNGINIRLGGSEDKFAKGIIIEDCIVTHFDDNILVVDDWARKQGVGIPGRLEIVIRRNIIRFASGTDSHSGGIYIEGSKDSIIEQNLIDHNGWAQTDPMSHRNKRSHNIYAQSYNGPLIIRHNVIARGAAHGLQLRAGGDIIGNIFVRNALAFFTSHHDSKANYNIILESDDINPEVPEDQRGMGIQGWGMDYYEVIGNVIANRVGSLERPGIEIAGSRLLIKENVVYNWEDRYEGTSIQYDSGRPTLVGNLAPEYFGGDDPDYVEPGRGLPEYAASMELNATNEALLNAMSNRGRGLWPIRLSPDTIADYVRAGYELK